MANVFGILTAIVLALSALIAFKNKTNLEARNAEIDKQKDAIVASKATLKKKQADLEVFPEQLATIVKDADAQAVAEAAQIKINEGFKATAEEKAKVVATVKAQLDQLRADTEKYGNLEETVAKIVSSKQEVESLEGSVSSAQSKLTGLTAQTTSGAARVNAAKNTFESYTTGNSLPSLKTRIRSIYPNWGFVTLASGNNAGVVTNSTLNVVRDGQVVAKLIVTAVESTTSSASIVPDSMAPDSTLMVGDRVEPGIKEPAKVNASATVSK
jgi:hypothetical protein